MHVLREAVAAVPPHGRSRLGAVGLHGGNHVRGELLGPRLVVFQEHPGHRVFRIRPRFGQFEQDRIELRWLDDFEHPMLELEVDAHLGREAHERLRGGGVAVAHGAGLYDVEQRRAVLEAVLQRLRPGGVVVVPLATVEALGELRLLLEAAGLQVAIRQLQVWRGAPLGDGTRLSPLNPVLVLSGRRT